MSRVGLVVGFSPDNEAVLRQLQSQLLDSQVIEDSISTALPLHMNMASWLLPNLAAADSILPAIQNTQQLDLHVAPFIDVLPTPRCGLQPVMTHILNVWHFQIHKALELPYLADDERDVPKRWRPFISLGAARAVSLNDIQWPKTLRCCEALLVDKDAQRIIARQDLIPATAVPW